MPCDTDASAYVRRSVGAGDQALARIGYQDVSAARALVLACSSGREVCLHLGADRSNRRDRSAEARTSPQGPLPQRSILSCKGAVLLCGLEPDHLFLDQVVAGA